MVHLYDMCRSKTHTGAYKAMSRILFFWIGIKKLACEKKKQSTG